MKYAGIDYSMTSPGIAVYDTNKKKYTYHFLTSKKKLIGSFYKKQIIGHEYPDWVTQEERFDRISDWVLNVISGTDHVRIEGYSFAAKGAAIFQTGENTGLLKNKLWRASIPFSTIAPSSVKKAATGKGRCGKGDMYESFYKQTGIDLMKILDMKSNDKNPISDIVDAHFICESIRL